MMMHNMNGNPLAGCCCCCCWPALLAVVYVLGVVFWCLICRKAGWSWALGLISLIPGIGSVLLFFIVALAQWPIERELRAAQARNVQRQA